MITNLQFIGIYEDAIDEAVDSSENALRICHLEDRIDELNEEALNDLKYTGSFDDITNSIIMSYFSTAKALIEKYAKNNYNPDFYVNCSDSHFYLDGEEV